MSIDGEGKTDVTRDRRIVVILEVGIDDTHHYASALRDPGILARDIEKAIGNVTGAATAYDVTVIGHTDYSHPAGYLFDCPACEARCYCAPDAAQCVWSGHRS